jgi:site-specific DNA recombinase
MKTAIYMRVSTSDQSIDAQWHAICSFLASKSITEYQIYQDEGFSGKNDNRPALKTLLDDCKQGKVERVVVYKLDRLFRSLQDLLSTLELFRTLNITFVSISESIDLSTPMGRLMMQLVGAFAEFERNLIVERTTLGLRAAMLRGSKPGRPQTIGNETRSRVITHLEAGLSLRKIATLENISAFSVQRIKAVHANKIDSAKLQGKNE